MSSIITSNPSNTNEDVNSCIQYLSRYYWYYLDNDGNIQYYNFRNFPNISNSQYPQSSILLQLKSIQTGSTSLGSYYGIYKGIIGVLTFEFIVYIYNPFIFMNSLSYDYIINELKNGQGSNYVLKIGDFNCKTKITSGMKLYKGLSKASNWSFSGEDNYTYFKFIWNAFDNTLNNFNIFVLYINVENNSNSAGYGQLNDDFEIINTVGGYTTYKGTFYYNNDVTNEKTISDLTIEIYNFNYDTFISSMIVNSTSLESKFIYFPYSEYYIFPQWYLGCPDGWHPTG